MKLLLLLFLLSFGFPFNVYSQIKKTTPEITDAKLQLEQAKTFEKLKKPEEAKKWAQKAADQGLADAWYWLGQRSLDPNPLYEKAAQQGHSDAINRLVDQYLYRVGTNGLKFSIEKLKTLEGWIKKSNAKIYNQEETLSVLNHCIQAGEIKIPKNEWPSESKRTEIKKTHTLHPIS